MPVKSHCEMLAKQFLLQTTNPDHPNHTNSNYIPPRLMKKTLHSALTQDVLPFAPDDVSEPINIKYGLKTLHTTCVQNAIDRQLPNQVLNTPAPEINKAEETLQRRARTTLAQLRSGYSPFLQSYMARINPTEHSELCPKCNAEPHTTSHLFSCIADTTELTVQSPWEDPVAAAKILGLQLGRDPGDLDDND